MLVLSRKKNDSIVIDGGIKVTVLEVKGNVVRIGIEAPANVIVRRSELLQRGERPDKLPSLQVTAPELALAWN